MLWVEYHAEADWWMNSTKSIEVGLFEVTDWPLLLDGMAAVFSSVS